MVRAMIGQEQHMEGQVTSRPGLESWPCVPCVRFGFPWTQFPHLKIGNAQSCESDRWKVSVPLPNMPFPHLSPSRSSSGDELALLYPLYLILSKVSFISQFPLKSVFLHPLSRRLPLSSDSTAFVPFLPLRSCSWLLQCLYSPTPGSTFEAQWSCFPALPILSTSCSLPSKLSVFSSMCLTILRRSVLLFFLSFLLWCYIYKTSQQ